MKKCSICKQQKNYSEFNKRTASKDGLQSACRECSHKHFKKYYTNNHEKHRASVVERNKKLVIRNREWLFEYLKVNPCVDCGNPDIRVLEFDHVCGTKKAGVGRLISNGCSIETIKEEIAKCEVRCRNCHQIKTFERMGGTWHDKLLASVV